MGRNASQQHHVEAGAIGSPPAGYFHFTQQLSSDDLPELDFSEALNPKKRISPCPLCAAILIDSSDHQIPNESRIHVLGSIWCDLTLGFALMAGAYAMHLLAATQSILASPSRSQPTQLRLYHALLYITGLHLATITIRCRRVGFISPLVHKLVGSTSKAGLDYFLPGRIYLVLLLLDWLRLESFSSCSEKYSRSCGLP
ncbi:hypothetical protein BJX63DRAFT_49459 [Aspergillus granulosus]|uniref:Uncharacterized protein n=1 Tax=Aspergillus granulosus TaxID=176169 RepID=A0ABR4GYT1_9EURO